MYRRFFGTKEPPFIMESIYIKAYEDLGCVSIRKNGKVLLFLEENKCVECGETGFVLIKDEIQFRKYISDFTIFLNRAQEETEKCVQDRNICYLLQIFERFLDFYRFTESFYTDRFYADNNDVIREQIEFVKTIGRIFLNKFFNGSDSLLNRIAEKISDMSILNMTVDEIYGNANIEDLIMEKRKKNHVIIGGEYFEQDTLEFLYFESLMCEDQFNNNTLNGLSVSSGNIRGIAYVLNADFTNYDKLEKLIEEMPEGSVLVTETTSPDLIFACHKAIGIITNQGGYGSHAAIISRELKIPCIVNTKIATECICTGDIVEIDGDNNRVLIVKSNQYIIDDKD